MKEYMFEVALKKASIIRDKVKETGLEDVVEDARKQWIIHDSSRDPPETYGAVDGSNNTLEFKGLTFYAVMGYSVTREDRVREYYVGDIDILFSGDTSEHVRLLREIVEAKAALLASNTDLLLVDGSIRSLLIRPRPFTENNALRTAINELERIDEEIFYKLWDGIVEQMNSGGDRLFEPFISRRLSIEYGLLSEEKLYLSVLLEYIEKLLTLRLLLEKMVVKKNKPSIIYISKTSRTRHYFKNYKNKTGKPLPSDIIVFAYATREPGYSKPFPLKIDKGFPSEGSLRELVHSFYNGIDFRETYMRFGEGLPLLKIEVPIPKNMAGDMEEIAETLYDMVKPLTVNGYPYPLIEADKASKITREDIIYLAQVIGLLPRITGREVLVEWL